MPDKMLNSTERILITALLGLVVTAVVLVSSDAPAQAQADPAVNAGELEPGLLGKIPERYTLWELYDPNSSVWEANPTPEGYRRVSDSVVTGFARWMRYFPMRAPKEPLITWTGAFISGPSVIGGVLDFITNSVGYTSRGSLYHIMKEYVRSVERELEMYVLATSGDSVTVYGYLTGSYSRNAQRTKVFWKEGERKALDEATLGRYAEIARVYTTFESLIRDCQKISEDEVMPGDVYITLDTAAVDAGHLALVLDVAERLPDAAESVPGLDRQPAPRLYLFSNSLTPATNYHIVKPIKPNKGNWFVPGELDMKLAGYPDGAYYRLPYAYLR